MNEKQWEVLRESTFYGFDFDQTMTRISKEKFEDRKTKCFLCFSRKKILELENKISKTLKELEI